jgi:hypothetical protein
MKGQYFLIGAVILSSLFFLALPLSTQVSRSESGDFSYISDNLKSEFPHAVNLGIKSGNPPQTLSAFTGVVRDSLKERFVDSGFLWIVSIGQGTSEITVYTGNFLGSTEEITLTVGSDQRTFTLSDSSYSSQIFDPVSSPNFDISLSFQGEQKTFTWKRDKANLYVFSLIQRNQDIAKLDITG